MTSHCDCLTFCLSIYHQCPIQLYRIPQVWLFATKFGEYLSRNLQKSDCNWTRFRCGVKYPKNPSSLWSNGTIPKVVSFRFHNEGFLKFNGLHTIFQAISFISAKYVCWRGGKGVHPILAVGISFSGNSHKWGTSNICTIFTFIENVRQRLHRTRLWRHRLNSVLCLYFSTKFSGER